MQYYIYYTAMAYIYINNRHMACRLTAMVHAMTTQIHSHIHTLHTDHNTQNR